MRVEYLTCMKKSTTRIALVIAMPSITML